MRLQSVLLRRPSAAAVVALGVYAYHHFQKTSDRGFNQAREAAKAHNEVIDAATKGKEVDEKSVEAEKKDKQALKTAAEATMEGAQLPGTSTGGDIGFKPEDAITAVITTAGLGAEVDAAKKQAEENAKKERRGRGKRKEDKLVSGYW